MNRRSTVVLACWIWVGLVGVWASPGDAGSPDCGGHLQDRLPIRVREVPRFIADTHFVAEGRDAYRLEVLVSVLNDDLQFVKRDERYLARYEITAIAEDRGGSRVTGDQVRKRRWEDTYDATNDTQVNRMDRIALKLGSGKHKIVIRVKDVDSGMESEALRELDLPDVPEGPWISGLRFLEGRANVGTRVDPSSDAWLTRKYSEKLPIMPVYVELYGWEECSESPELRYEIEDAEGHLAGEGVCRELGIRGIGQGYVVEQRTDSLSVGTYELKVVLAAEGKDRSVACGRFSVLSSHAMWGRDYEEMLELLSYIATSDELDNLKDLPVEEREEAWEEFWAGQDPTSGTDRNETRELFFERVAFANENFEESLRKGWRTDRGRIYILEGPPDRIESHPMDIDSKPWEAWYYDRRGRTYIFVDRNGFGEYVLVGTR